MLDLQIQIEKYKIIEILKFPSKETLTINFNNANFKIKLVNL
jgi:hypothetical protein